MPTIEIRVPELHPAQRLTDSEARRFSVWNCGRRFGKSVLSRRRLLRHAAAGKPVGYFCPTYKMISEYWRETVEEWQPLIERISVQEKRIELKTGGILDMWSLDSPDGPRGRKYAHVAIDEAAMIAHLQEAWQRVIRPTLTDFQGSADFYSTPRGRNYFWQIFQQGQDNLNGEWISWHLPTLSNPFIARSEVEAAQRELPLRVFEQEYLAQFLEDGGGVFRRVMEGAAAPLNATPYAGDFVMGVDWAQSNDWTVLVVVDSATKRMVDFDRFNQIGWDVQRDRVKVMAAKWGVKSILAESNSIGGPNIEQLQKEGLPAKAFTTTNASKSDIIIALSGALERGDFEIQNEPVMINELQSFEATRLPSGVWRYAAPSGAHDDTVIALALAWEAVNAPKPIQAWFST